MWNVYVMYANGDSKPANNRVLGPFASLDEARRFEATLTRYSGTRHYARSEEGERVTLWVSETWR